MPRHSQHSQPQHPRRQNASSSSSKPGKTGHSTLYTWLLSLLATFLLGTVLVLSIVKSFFGVDWNDALDVEEVKYYDSLQTLPYGSSVPSTPDTNTTIEKVPRIIHQTWKTTVLPTKWAKLSSQCQAMHPDFEFKLWTDESSIDFLKEHYNWFLPTFLEYKFDIQRADAIRYFVLHKYGGVYMDLDIGCRRPIHSLLNFPAILPATKPVGVSNDLMVAEPNSQFMDSVIHNLIAFDHAYLSDYPTVMFSTGPMFLSAVLSLWNSKTSYAGVDPSPGLNSSITSRSPLSSNNAVSNLLNRNTLFDPLQIHDSHSVRILPRELYGKNIEPELVPDSFFYHYYGSSWHQNDSFIFTFLGQFGKTLMNVAFVVVIFGTAFIVIRRIRRRRKAGAIGATRDGYILALDYDSDIEEGNGRATPPLSLPLPSASSTPRSASSARRSRRRQYRRAVAAGARNWLFGGGNTNSSNPIVGGGRRRSASTGAISLPVHSSESGSEDALFYTSSSEDGLDTRRGSTFERYQAQGPNGGHHSRRASVWTDDDDLREATSSAGAGDIESARSSNGRVSPTLHRRASSQPATEARSKTPLPSSRTPVPPGYLELPPPPPYRPPSPLLPTSPNHQNKSWYSTFFSRIPSPSSSQTSSPQFPFFSNNTTNGSSNTISNNDSRNASLQDRPAVIASNNPSSSSTHAQLYNHTRHSSMANNEEDPERDADTFSLHSVKAQR